ncbi:hypothetical protein UFOVP708_28 [uncultured Caudovirales phage]|uniref:Uncharacterized protein n=1 Tax=uncultured Caudovirales phage TaxID=2100421 RepID=A0A6J5NN63_9CAUD|nr:hypothetical protein UFOVP708_28 [uncultured Caudovirales phage]
MRNRADVAFARWNEAKAALQRSYEEAWQAMNEMHDACVEERVARGEDKLEAIAQLVGSAAHESAFPWLRAINEDRQRALARMAASEAGLRVYTRMAQQQVQGDAA